MIHRTLDGKWAKCSDATCELKFHLPELTLAEAQALPLMALLPLLEIIDPPDDDLDFGDYKAWTVPSEVEGNKPLLHRGYDLPAVIWPDGTLEWWYRDQLHRNGGKPARIWPSGACDYYVHGIVMRATP